MFKINTRPNLQTVTKFPLKIVADLIKHFCINLLIFSKVGPYINSGNTNRRERLSQYC
jgi:hypothetical protein